jgi:Cation transporter/ATPase, N-terminus
MEDGFAKTSDEVLKFFGTNEEVGLTPDQVKTLQAKYGPNGKSALILLTVFVLAAQTHNSSSEEQCCKFYGGAISITVCSTVC